MGLPRQQGQPLRDGRPARATARDHARSGALKHSAGVLLYRRKPSGPEVLLVLPGGPYWARRDLGAWQIPKGELCPGEDPEQTARRELAEETGLELAAPLVPLGEVRQAGGKRVTAFAAEHDLDPAGIVSNRFEMEWPRGSGRRQSFPEVAAARWFTLDEARAAMLPSQQPLLERLPR